MKSYFVGRSGELENTMFAILSPEGKLISRAGRSPDAAFADAADMAKGMKELAARYQAKKDAKRELPVLKNVRLALDVAACDGRACVASLAAGKEGAAKQEEALTTVAWSEGVEGTFVYATTTDAKELEAVKGITRKSGFLVIEPDAYGLEGKILAEIDAKTTGKDLEKALLKANEKHVVPDKDPDAHIREGHRLGVEWETEIPDTDPGPGGRGPR